MTNLNIEGNNAGASAVVSGAETGFFGVLDQVNQQQKVRSFKDEILPETVSIFYGWPTKTTKSHKKNRSAMTGPAQQLETPKFVSKSNAGDLADLLFSAYKDYSNNVTENCPPNDSCKLDYQPREKFLLTEQEWEGRNQIPYQEFINAILKKLGYSGGK